MAGNGIYMAWRVRTFLLPPVETYGPCVLNDILPSFENLDKRADEIGEKEYERLGSLPAYNEADMDTLAERAHDKGVTFYQTMMGMRQATVNLFSAGLFHLVEQQLACLFDDAAFSRKPTDTQLTYMQTFYRDHLRLELHRLHGWEKVDELRLLANTVKHAEGKSATQLRTRRPDLFEDAIAKTLPFKMPPQPIWQPLAGEGLYVSEEHFKEYADAAVAFFEALAQYFDDHRDETYPAR